MESKHDSGNRPIHFYHLFGTLAPCLASDRIPPNQDDPELHAPTTASVISPQSLPWLTVSPTASTTVTIKFNQLLSCTSQVFSAWNSETQGQALEMLLARQVARRHAHPSPTHTFQSLRCIHRLNHSKGGQRHLMKMHSTIRCGRSLQVDLSTSPSVRSVCVTQQLCSHLLHRDFLSLLPDEVCM